VFDLEHLEHLIKAIGHLGIFAIIFAESGLLIGFFLPGDSLLFTAGFLASQGYLNIVWLVVGCFIAAVTGDSVGYWFGQRVGRPLFDRPESRFFKKKHLLAAEAFYEKHGGKTIILARFLPFIRTFAPIVAGIAQMSYGRFLFFNVVGGALWAIGLPLAGYWLGSLIPDVDKYLIPIILAIIIVSVLPSALHVFNANREEIIRLLQGRRRGGSVALEAEESKE
jgi:membrane-associated protein